MRKYGLVTAERVMQWLYQVDLSSQQHPEASEVRLQLVRTRCIWVRESSVEIKRTFWTTFVSLSTYFACSITKQTRPDSPGVTFTQQKLVDCRRGARSPRLERKSVNVASCPLHTHEKIHRVESRWDVDRTASGSVFPAAASCTDHTRLDVSRCVTLCHTVSH
eukprot:COSAG02_NODE_2270_length_9267_cov_13.803992_3_plen_163_part_00